MTLRHYTYRLIHFLLLIITLVIGDNLYSQTTRVGDFGLEYPVYYSAYDSIVANVPDQKVKLFGNSEVKYGDIVLKAEIIEIDIIKGEVSAIYGLDSIGNIIGSPEFKTDNETVKCEYLKYNFSTEQAYITEVRTQQGEGYIHMSESKRLPNEEMHFKNGKYTTCDREKPHYHFDLTKAIVVPNKRIITGPIYMRILNFPIPLAAPFALLPNSESRKHGILMPKFNIAGPFGSGLQDLGYYIPLNKKWETYIYGSLFTSGRWGLRSQTNYNVKYKHTGTFRVGYERLKETFFEKSIANNYTVYWNHNQHAKAHPSLRFGANIDFRSNNNAKQSLDIIPDNVFNSSFNSAINLNKSWRMNKFAGSWTSKVSLRQNSNTKNYAFELPSFNLSVNRFDLGVFRKAQIGKKWYENITVTYNLNSLNRINVADSIINESFNSRDYSFLTNNDLNGIEQKFIIQSNLKPKTGWFTFNLNSTFNERWNFQSIEKEWNTTTNLIDTNFINGLQSARDISFSGSITTNMYGYLKTVLPSKLKFRHVISPNISFTYQPDLGQHQIIQIDTFGAMGVYSPFDLSLYKERRPGESGLITFSLGNVLEMKKLDKKDTINKTFKNYKLIDRFNINGNYDMMQDSFNLSNLRLNLQTTPIKGVNFQSSLVLTPYEWDIETGDRLNNYAWNSKQGIGRIDNFNINLNSRHNYRGEKSDTLNNFKNSNLDINFQYNINYSRRNNGIIKQDTFKLDHTVRIYGKVNLWKIWYIDYDVMTDLMGLTTTPNPSARLAIRRELHCWETSLEFRKNGNFFKSISNNIPPRYSILLKLNIKASMFSSFLPPQKIRIPGI